jgi:hypothetical protein
MTSMTPIHDGIRVVGGASFQAKIGTLSASWPLCALQTTDEGVTVDLRLRLLKRLLGRFVLGERSAEWWTASWAQFTSVEFGPRSLVVRCEGDSACRFVAMSRARLLPLVELFKERGIPVTPVKSTIFWFTKPS